MNKKNKTIVYITVLTVLFLITSYYRYSFPAIAVIGSADGPTAICLKGNVLKDTAVYLAIVMVAAVLIGVVMGKWGKRDN